MDLENLELIFLNEESEINEFINKLNNRNVEFIKISSQVVTRPSVLENIRNRFKINRIKEIINRRKKMHFSQVSKEIYESLDFMDEEIEKSVNNLIWELYRALLKYNSDNSFYQYLDIDILRIDRERILFYLKESLIIFYILEKIIRKFKPKKIKYSKIRNLHYHIFLKELCRKYKILYENQIYQSENVLFRELGIVFESITKIIINKYRSIKFKKFSPIFHESKPNLLFFCNTNNQVKTAIPVLRKIMNQSDFNPIVILPQDTSGTKSKLLINHRIPFFLNDNLPLKKGKKPENREMIIKKVLNKYNIKDFISKFNPKIDPKYKIKASILRRILYLFLESYIQRTKWQLRNIEIYKKCFEIFKPKLTVIFSVESSEGNLFDDLSKIYNVKSLFIPHASVSTWYSYDKLTVSYMASSGNIDKEVFINLGSEEEKFVKTGHPRYDDLYDQVNKFRAIPKIELKKKIAQKLNLNFNKGYILYAGTNYGDQIRKKMVKSILEVMESLKEYELIIKLHPNESPDLIVDLVKKSGRSWPVIKYYDLYELIMASELLISRSSGSEFEAMLMDRNVVDINYEINDDLYRFIEYGAALRVYDPKELLNSLLIVLNDTKTKESLSVGRKKYIADYLYKFDGKASDRIYELIQKIVKDE